jgi:xylan 1,4-beta-xylosidase
MTYNISTIVFASHSGYGYLAQAPLLNYTVDVKNRGKIASNYTAMLFASTSNKWLVGFDRLGSITPGQTSTMTITVSIGAMVRAATSGDSILYPGTYKLALNPEQAAPIHVTLTGDPAPLAKWPLAEQEIAPNHST